MKYQKEFSSSEQSRIESNFQRLKGIHYLDHSGTTLYAEKQIQRAHSNLVSNVYCNPHTSKLTGERNDQVRSEILRWFNTTSHEYSVIFTSGATASLKLLAESFDFGEQSSSGCFSYLRDNHTSVLGMREIVKTDNIICIERTDFLHGEFSKSLEYDGNSLLVYPGQCNFSGYKYPLSAIRNYQTANSDTIQRSNRYVCLDAAAFAATNQLDLSRWHPDFVCVSFYKIFGFPTGLGALIVSRRGECVLKKCYYGGGTVKIVFSNDSGWHRKRDLLHERFEDGTQSYLSIISLLAGFETIKQLIPGDSMQRVSRHCFHLAKYLYDSLKELKHWNGQNVVQFYHDTAFESISHQGGVVNFNVLRDDGSYVGFSQVARMALENNIYLRAGCFCNPGACQRHFKLKDGDLVVLMKSDHICGDDDNDIIDGFPMGSIRISMGYMTKIEDVKAAAKMIKKCFCIKDKGNQINTKYEKYRTILDKYTKTSHEI